MNKYVPTKNNRRLILLGGSLAILIVSLGIFVIYGFKQENGADRSVGSENGNGIIRSGGIAGKVNDMHLSGSTLFYTNHGDKLFYFDKLSNAGKFVANIEITPGSSFFEEKGYIYYSNGKGIFERSLKDNISKQLLTGKNIWLNTVNNGKLFYYIAFEDSKKGGFNEYEIHIYDLSTGKDIVLFNGCEDMWWHILTVDKNIVIADASMKNDSGLFFIDIATGTRRKLSNLRVHEGCFLNGKYYYTSQEDKGLWGVNLNTGKQEKIPIPGMNKTNFFVDRITGFGNYLYIAAYYNDNNHIISVNLQTHDTTILADGFGRVWKLCTDGKSIYAYDTKSPADMKGEITIMNN
ncbi:DUF5050 domain-containing protein [Pseudobacteroides cellulosolvens]|uniref:Prolow-density lipoprotein receptor-related protein 1-like beta-propeller domain-containing protein n=1 Tax=Pseudobacteroides cellulosolvens ATCC 35603 = DSM 2933 TaxID=398512 RepID=A0A0L6JS78_9FIRM|nr:DUF5050 domain-containing protein [Pseudobacteroides cellulosolvens]KNY28570.1 hypothetical protein Bccel_3844 [Pseudobacteroides cellulosolvens ATCC 35603 = DSM 2933]